MYDIQKSYNAHSVEEALTLLEKHDDAVLVAGGTDILIKIRERKIKQAVLVSILDIPEIKNISQNTDGSIIIGAGCNFSQITEDARIRKQIPMLSEACRQVGSPQIRNIATIGGNICNGAVSADSVAPLYALDARLTICSLNGNKTLPIREFHTGPGKTILKHGEMLTSIHIPYESFMNHGSAYYKFGQRRAMEIATLGCAVNISLSKDKKRINTAAIAFTVAAPTPRRCPITENRISGLEINPELFQIVRSNVLSELSPRESWRASLELREQLIKELAERTLKEAIKRAEGKLD